MSTNDRQWAMRLPADLFEQLEQRARREERSPAGVMRLLARLYVESEPGEPLYPAGSPTARSSG